MDTKQLLNILVMVMPAVEKKTTIAQHDHFVFHNRCVSTYNGKIFFSHPIPLDIECSVIAADLIEILKTVSSDTVELSVDGSKLLISSDDVKAEMSTEVYEQSVLNAIKSMGISDIKWDDAADVPKYFIDGLSQCRFSVSRDASDQRNCHCLHVIDDAIESGDGYRCAEYVMDGKMQEMLIPATAAAVLINCTPVCYVVHKGWAHFMDVKENIFSVRLVEGDFPDVGKIISNVEKSVEKLTLPDTLQDLLGKFTNLSEGDSDVYKFVTITIKDGVVTAFTKKATCNITKKINISDKETDISFSISPVFLMSIMDRTKEIHINKDMKMAMFMFGSFTHVIVLPAD